MEAIFFKAKFSGLCAGVPPPASGMERLYGAGGPGDSVSVIVEWQGCARMM